MIIIITSLPLLKKIPTTNHSCALNFKSECLFRYKKAVIYNLISRTKLIPSPKTIFYKEKNNKKTNKQTNKRNNINNGFPNYIDDEQIKHTIKIDSQQNKHCNTPPNKQAFIKLFYRNQMHYNYKLNENILKTLIQKNILSTDHNKK